MNRTLLLIVTTMIVAIALTCCQKMEKPTQVGISNDDLALAQKIESFIVRMNTVASASEYNLKSGGELIDIDDAIWDLEAAANYTFADIPEMFDDIKVDTLEFFIAVNNGFCKESDLSDVYQEMNYAIEEFCDSLDEYQILGISVSLSDEITGKITVILMSVSVGDPNLSFGPTDYWRAGRGGGKCDIYNNQFIGRDASTEIKKKANASIPKIAIPAGYTVYYTDYYTKDVIEGAYPNPKYKHGIDDPLTEYLFYYSKPEYYYGYRCLPPDILNFYVNNLRKKAQLEWKPTGKTLLLYDWKFAYYVGEDEEIALNDEYHYGWVKYAKRHIKPGGPINP